ncbi:MAG: MFS transporter, partial [Deferrisomatales bacterium]
MDGEAKHPREERWRPERPAGAVVAALCLAEVLTMMGTFAFPALLPRFVGEWGLSNTQAGWLGGAYFGGYTLAVPVLASLTDRVDGRRVYLASAAVSGLAALGFAWLAAGFWSALGLRVLAGLGLAGTFIPGLKALVDRLEPAAHARAVSFYTASFGLGTSLSFFAAGQVGAALGWRWAFGAGAGGAALAFGLAAWALVPRPPVAGPAAAA